MVESNRLFCGDNLHVLRKHIADESIDLCYIDPPFHSRRNYLTREQTRGLTREQTRGLTREQTRGFSDIWTWDDAAQSGYDSLHRHPSKLASLLEGLHPAIGQGSLMAYLVSVAQRLTEIDRVLRCLLYTSRCV